MVFDLNGVTIKHKDLLSPHYQSK